MQVPNTLAEPLGAITGGLAVPRLSKVGAMVIVAGLTFDLLVHTVLSPIHDELHAFGVQEHLAHLLVVIGMVVVLGGVMADGISSHRRVVRQEGSTRDAIR